MDTEKGKKRVPIYPVVIAALLMGSVKMCNYKHESEKREQEIWSNIRNSMETEKERLNKIKENMLTDEVINNSLQKYRASSDSLNIVLEEAEDRQVQ